MPRGSHVNTAKLNEKQVQKILMVLASGKFTQDDIAFQFRVSRATISRIKNKKNWKHVTCSRRKNEIHNIV